MSPIYAFECDECANTDERVFAVKARNTPVMCNECLNQMDRIISCKIERLEAPFIDEMKQQLPPRERAKVYDRISFKKALKRSGLVTI